MTLDIDSLLAKSLLKDLPSPSLISAICTLASQILASEPNIIHINPPAHIVGDIHGQFDDLMELFAISGMPPSFNYVFLGDYVDRGRCSVEVILVLILLKIRYPSRVTLVRGNHESRAITQTYGFYAECVKKFPGAPEIWKYFTDMFDYLPLAAVVSNQIFCVHGGLSPVIHKLDQIALIDRVREIPHEGAMSDLVWSDPSPESPTQAESNTQSLDFSISPRGAGYLFGRRSAQTFAHSNNLTHIVRAHQLCMEGYNVLFDDLVSTVWSAPNYCYRAGNLASVLQIGVSCERTYNVFKTCTVNSVKPVRSFLSDDCLDVSADEKRRLCIETFGHESKHSLHDQVWFDFQRERDLRVENDRFMESISEYFT